MGAGYEAFEIGEPPENRRKWLAGLVRVARDLRPSSVAISDALAAVDEEVGTVASAEASSLAFRSIRSEILRHRPIRAKGERALYTAELSMKLLSNLAWIASPRTADFYRDTGWWLVQSALDGAKGAEREAWLSALIPQSFGGTT